MPRRQVTTFAVTAAAMACARTEPETFSAVASFPLASSSAAASASVSIASGFSSRYFRPSPSGAAAAVRLGEEEDHHNRGRRGRQSLSAKRHTAVAPINREKRFRTLSNPSLVVTSSSLPPSLPPPPLRQSLVAQSSRFGDVDGDGAGIPKNEELRPRTAENRAASAASSVRTSSFEPVWAGNLPPFLGSEVSTEEGMGNENASDVKVHTLILGTHPSVKSLKSGQYYGNEMNAFWWIAGDCLGFRRARGISSVGKPFKFTSNLRYGHDRIIPYDRQIRLLASRGFALWDVVRSCERKGSLDADIKNEEPNAIREFCASHPSVRRIVLANGGTGCAMFRKHFDGWWRSGELAPGPNEESIRAFRKYATVTAKLGGCEIRCISAVSVSPAAASYSYEEKRDFWEEFVYKPGLKDHMRLTSEKMTGAY